MGETHDSMVAHARNLLHNPPEPKYVCWVCSVEFVYEHDFRLHRQHHQASQWLSECEDSLTSSDELWIKRAAREKFEADLRVWEKFQLYRYLEAIDTSVERRLSKDISVVSRLSEHSERSSPSLFVRRSVNSLQLCPSRLQTSQKTDFATMITNFSRVTLLGDESIELIPADPQGNKTSLVQGSCKVARSPHGRALRMGRIDQIRIILTGRQRHLCGVCERYALCPAAMGGDLEALCVLIEAGVDPDVLDQISCRSAP